MSPFFANYGQDPLWQFDLTTTSKQSSKRTNDRFAPNTVSEERAAKQLVEKFKEITEYLQAELSRTQMVHQEQADKKRKPALALRIGDQVWFNTRNLST